MTTLETPMDASLTDTPFHVGELEVQQRAGVSARLEEFARKGIRSFMPEQHREFFAKLPFLIVGAADPLGWPWAGILTGQSGFVDAPEPTLLRIRATPGKEDPLRAAWSEGASLGMLGIEFHSRRRNRANGTLSTVGPEVSFVRVNQSFGNCAQYIHGRQARWIDNPKLSVGNRAARKVAEIDAELASLVAGAGTFFIASQFGGTSPDPRYGLDVSHRGGLPGFLTLVDARTLVWPDFRGNFFFNTLGNLQINDRCGLLLIDFSTGTTLQLTGRAEVLWEWDRSITAFQDAQRLVRFHLDHGVHTALALPLVWDFKDVAPQFVVTPGKTA